MGCDIHSMLEVKSKKKGRWIIVGKNLTVECFDLDKECPELGVNFEDGAMEYDWRDCQEDYDDFIGELMEQKKWRDVFTGNIEPKTREEKIALQDYKAVENGHNVEDERIVCPYAWRDYGMFGIFANCRYGEDDVEPIAKPKGWPKDMSDFVVLRNFWYESEEVTDDDWDYIVCDGNYHHISYLSVGEIEHWLEAPLEHVRYEKLRKRIEEYCEGSLRKMVAEMKKLLTLPDVTDVRMVFGFDS